MSHPIFPSGSEWRQWDLHAHSPLSFEWQGGRLDLNASESERNAVLAGVVADIEKSPVSVIAILDYWTLDGYIALRQFIRQQVPSFSKKILPGIELRVEAPTDFRLNAQVLFDDALTDERLREFVSKLAIPMTSSAGARPPSSDAFAEYAKGLDVSKLKAHGFSEQDRNNVGRMRDAGMKIARITRESLEAAVAHVGRDSCVVVLPWSTNDGLSKLKWEKHSHEATRLIRLADALECRDTDNIDLCLGRATPANANFIDAFREALGPRGKVAPVCGSDAHVTSNYGVFPSGRKLWVKADPTFAGLQQAIREPDSRIFIGTEPEKLAHVRSNATRYLKRLVVKKRPGAELNEVWFDSDIPLNPGLVAVIGNKGSGKSALADIIALVANAHCSDMSFLNADRFCNPREKKGAAFEATLTSFNGGSATRTLDERFDKASPEHCRYLTQGYLEDLCNKIYDDGATAFERELKKVIFSHAEPEDRERFASLDEAVAYQTDGSKSLLYSFRTRLTAVNEELVALEERNASEARRALANQLAGRQAELEAHDLAKPATVPMPSEATSDAGLATDLLASQAELQRIDAELLAHRNKLSLARQRAAVVSRVEGRLAAFQQMADTFVSTCAADLEYLEMTAEQIVTVHVSNSLLVSTRTAAEDVIRAVEPELREDSPLMAARRAALASVTALQNAMSAPGRAYQEYLTKAAKWQSRRNELLGRADIADSLLGLKETMRWLSDVLPTEIASKKAERTELVASIYEELSKIRHVYERMYAPVQAFANDHAVARQELDMEFRVTMRGDAFAGRFLDHINQARKGAFQGADEGRQLVTKMVAEASFESWSGMSAFLASLERALATDGEGAAVDVRAQLRRGYDLQALYRYIYGLEWMEVYGLSMKGKDLVALSPGERGALLLLFYLLLDKDGDPIIIDQPEQNLDNESVYRVLVPCIREVRERRQVILVTHNPNLAVVCDAEQIVAASLAKDAGCAVSYVSGSIENAVINGRILDVLEGTWPAFENRRDKYRQPSNGQHALESAAPDHLNFATGA